MTTDFHRSDVRAVCSLFRLTAHGHTLKSKYRYDAAAAATPRILPQVFVVIAFFSLSLSFLLPNCENEHIADLKRDL